MPTIAIKLLHDLTTMHSVILKYVKTYNTWKAKVMAAKDRAMSADYHYAETTEREAKLKGEMVAQLKEKDDVLIQKHGWVADVVTKLDHYKVLHWLAKSRAQMNKD